MSNFVLGPTQTASDSPIALRPATYERFTRAVQYVEKMNRATAPRTGRGRTTSATWGAWGLLQPGDVITGVSGMTLGEGDVTLCTRDGAELTADGDVTHVYNRNRRLKAGGSGVLLQLQWVSGCWMPLIPNFAIGKANGPISAASGSTYGTGLVDLYESDTPYGYGYGDEDGPTDTIEVLNPSSELMDSGNGIDDGLRVSVAWDVRGNPWVAPLECAAAY